VHSNIIISINGLSIMVTLISVYLESIKISCKIFVKYIMPILQVYPNHLIIFLKIITNDILNYYLLILYFILITHVIKILNFNIIFDYNFKILIFYYIMTIMMVILR
jgi:hypothetical protein